MANPALTAQAAPLSDAQAAFERGRQFMDAGNYQGALTEFEASLQQEQHVASWVNLGIVLRKLGHLHASLACTGRALEVFPNNPEFLTNYGNCLVDLDRGDEALKAHATAVQQAPDKLNIRLNYAIALREFGQLEEALPHLEAACALEPDHVEARWERAITRLQLGRLREGWHDYELRWERKNKKQREHILPRWQGQEFKGKTLLVYEEQGYGDTILCSRYLPMVQARGGRVILQCRSSLHRLFQTLPGVDRIIESGRLEEKPHYYIQLMSLPGIFDTDIDSIPPVPPLHVPSSAPQAAQQLLDLAKGRFKVGIVWSGNTEFRDNRKRAVSAARFLSLAEVPGVQLYSLQMGTRADELGDLGALGLIPAFGPHISDFADTAAIVKELDLVIMTDSSVAHLAGSLGRPVWNLLSYRPFWLYMTGREDSPWYPSMRLFRQTEPGNWDAVFLQVKSELGKAACLRSDSNNTR